MLVPWNGWGVSFVFLTFFLTSVHLHCVGLVFLQSFTVRSFVCKLLVLIVFSTFFRRYVRFAPNTVLTVLGLSFKRFFVH